MKNEILEKGLKTGEKTAFSDTGSTIFTNLGTNEDIKDENQCVSAQNDENASNNNCNYNFSGEFLSYPRLR